MSLSRRFNQQCRHPRPEEQFGEVAGKCKTNKLNNQSFNPGEYSNDQLQVIDGLLEQGVLKGPRMGEIVKTFSVT